MDWLRYKNQNAVRNQPLDPEMVSALSFLDGMGITMEVFSGGQPVKGSGKPRVGSTRHDKGRAADVFFYKDGERLNWANKEDIPVFQDIVRQAKANGLTGFGAGPGYMREGSMHIGYGAPAVWGDDGKGANAPNWLREAYGAPPVPASMSGNKMGYGAMMPPQQAPMGGSAPVQQQNALRPPQIAMMDPRAFQMQTNALPIYGFGPGQNPFT